MYFNLPCVNVIRCPRAFLWMLTSADPKLESCRITVRLRIMAKRSWPELIRNAALLGLIQPNLETGARRTGRYTLFGLAGGRFREIDRFVWNLLAFARRGSAGRSPAFPSFVLFSTQWKESRLNGFKPVVGQIGYEIKVREFFESIFRVIMIIFFRSVVDSNTCDKIIKFESKGPNHK